MIPPDVSRKLTAIEHALAADMPALAARFELFNRLAVEDGPVTAEPVADPPQSPSRPQPRPAHLAVLLVLGAVVALCLTLSLHLSPETRQCVIPTAGEPGAFTPVHALTCSAYATNK